MGINKDKKMKNIVLFASGNGSNVQNIADYFSSDKEVAIKLIVCNNKDAYVLERAKQLGIESLLIDRNTFYNSNEVIAKLENIKPELIVLAGFLWLLPENIINAYSHKIINIHPALLPKYGGKGMYGMNVHRAVWENKEKKSGISIHYVNKEYDKGNLIFQETCEITPADTPETIAEKVHQLEYLHFPQVIAQLLKEK
jgi:phosphoribosylglycinamide formyltransferase 1